MSYDIKVSLILDLYFDLIFRTTLRKLTAKQREETGFAPTSKSTLLRVLDACSASVCKSLQGLDNFYAQGSNASDDLCETVDRIADRAESQAWAKETKQILRDAKQYLRADYKVRL